MSQNDEAVKVARGASFIFIQNIGSAIVQILSFALIARIISQADLGITAALILILSIFNTITNLGLPNIVAKFVAELIAKGDRSSAAGVFYQILRINILLCITAGFVCFISSNWISSLLFKTVEYSLLLQLQ